MNQCSCLFFLVVHCHIAFRINWLCQCHQKPCDGQKGIVLNSLFIMSFGLYIHISFKPLFLWLAVVLFAAILTLLTDSYHYHFNIFVALQSFSCLEPYFLLLGHGIQHRGFVLVHVSPVLVLCCLLMTVFFMQNPYLKISLSWSFHTFFAVTSLHYTCAGSIAAIHFFELKFKMICQNTQGGTHTIRGTSCHTSCSFLDCRLVQWVCFTSPIVVHCCWWCLWQFFLLCVCVCHICSYALCVNFFTSLHDLWLMLCRAF